MYLILHCNGYSIILVIVKHFLLTNVSTIRASKQFCNCFMKTALIRKIHARMVPLITNDAFNHELAVTLKLITDTIKRKTPRLPVLNSRLL